MPKKGIVATHEANILVAKKIGFHFKARILNRAF